MTASNSGRNLRGLASGWRSFPYFWVEDMYAERAVDEVFVWTTRMKNKRRSKTTRGTVRKEMARPRMAQSARIAQLNLDSSRKPESPSTSMSGTVLRIIPSRHAGEPDSIQIALDVPEKQNRDFRIENTLTNEHGEDVKLKKGAPVEVTVTATAEKKSD
jgi:hypothetical protein